MNITTMRRAATQLACLLSLAFGVGLPAHAQYVEYIHTDALGSPVAVTDSYRVLLEHTDYEPYGKVLNHSLHDEPGYAGHVSDSATGLSYMQQRYYDPQVGRFISVDPVSVDEIRAWNSNRYNYAANNPYRFTDPDGRTISCDGQVCTIECTGFECGKDMLIYKGLNALIHLANAVNAIENLTSQNNQSNGGADNQPTGGSNDQSPDRDFTDYDGNKPPFEGEPGSTVRGGTGSRTYGDDGYPKTDRDTPHPDEAGTGGRDHVHDWGRPEGGGRPTANDRGPSREPKAGDPPVPRGANVPPPPPPQPRFDHD